MPPHVLRAGIGHRIFAAQTLLQHFCGLNPDAIELPDDHITGGRTIVAETASKTLGFAVVLLGHGGAAELDGLFVEPTAWRGGIGRSLIVQAAKLASAGGAQAIQVIANPRAKDFYRACGFVQVGGVATRFGTGLRMRKALSQRPRPVA